MSEEQPVAAAAAAAAATNLPPASSKFRSTMIAFARKIVDAAHGDVTDDTVLYDAAAVLAAAEEEVLYEASAVLAAAEEEEKSHREPQPPPVNKGENVPEAFRKWATGLKGFPQEAVALSLDRDKFGQAKYGQPLMTEDGRDAVEDAKDEIGDFLHYLHKAKMNKQDYSGLRALIEAARILAADTTDDETRKFAERFGRTRSRSPSRSPPSSRRAPPREPFNCPACGMG